MPVAAAALTAGVPLLSPRLLVSPAPPSIAGSRGNFSVMDMPADWDQPPNEPAFEGGGPGSDWPPHEVSFCPFARTGTEGNGTRTETAAKRRPSRSRSKAHDAGSVEISLRESSFCPWREPCSGGAGRSAAASERRRTNLTRAISAAAKRLLILLLPTAKGGLDTTADSGGCTQPGSAAPTIATSVLPINQIPHLHRSGAGGKQFPRAPRPGGYATGSAMEAIEKRVSILRRDTFAMTRGVRNRNR